MMRRRSAGCAAKYDSPAVGSAARSSPCRPMTIVKHSSTSSRSLNLRPSISAASRWDTRSSRGSTRRAAIASLVRLNSSAHGAFRWNRSSPRTCTASAMISASSSGSPMSRMVVMAGTSFARSWNRSMRRTRSGVDAPGHEVEHLGVHARTAAGENSGLSRRRRRRTRAGRPRSAPRGSALTAPSRRRTASTRSADRAGRRTSRDPWRRRRPRRSRTRSSGRRSSPTSSPACREGGSGCTARRRQNDSSVTGFYGHDAPRLARRKTRASRTALPDPSEPEH